MRWVSIGGQLVGITIRDELTDHALPPCCNTIILLIWAGFAKDRRTKCATRGHKSTERRRW